MALTVTKWKKRGGKNPTQSINRIPILLIKTLTMAYILTIMAYNNNYLGFLTITLKILDSFSFYSCNEVKIGKAVFIFSFAQKTPNNVDSVFSLFGKFVFRAKFQKKKYPLLTDG